MNSGKPKTKASAARILLSERDQKVLALVGKFGISTFEIIHYRFFKGRNRDAVKSNLRRLCGRGPTYRYLRPVPLYGSRVVYQLTWRGANTVGASPSLARPLGIQSRVERLAVLNFIHDLKCEHKRRIISNARLREHFPLHGHRLPRQRFYLEERADGDYLGFIVVDHGGHERRIVRKAVSFLQRFVKREWFDDYLRSGRFILTILTLTEFKGRAIAYGLKKLLKQVLGKPLANLHKPFPGGWPLPVEIVVVPGVINVLPGKSSSKKARRK
jgi:hypothetical protein